MKPSIHPARSPEFLSRLHDGELDPGERARFEAHRAHCAECRTAAAEFETALTFYRASRTTPPPADLSARILRRLQAATPRRSPLGRSFGIDLKWAGAFAAALIAVLIGSSIVADRETRRRLASRESAPFSVVVADKAKESTPRASLESAPSDKLEKRAAARAQGSPSKTMARRGAAVSSREEADERAFAASPAPPQEAPRAARPLAREPQVAKDASETAAPRLDQQQRKPSEKLIASAEQPMAGTSRASAPRDQPGGEGAAAQTAAAPEPSPAVRLRVIAAPDGQGSSPVPVNADALELSPADRGEYLLVVQTDGSVASIHRAEAKRKSAGSLGAPPAAHEELKKLRFTPSDRPRRVLVRVE